MKTQGRLQLNGGQKQAVLGPLICPIHRMFSKPLSSILKFPDVEIPKSQRCQNLLSTVVLTSLILTKLSTLSWATQAIETDEKK